MLWDQNDSDSGSFPMGVVTSNGASSSAGIGSTAGVGSRDSIVFTLISHQIFELFLRVSRVVRGWAKMAEKCLTPIKD